MFAAPSPHRYRCSLVAGLFSCFVLLAGAAKLSAGVPPRRSHRHAAPPLPAPEVSVPGDSALVRVCLTRLASANRVVIGATPGATLRAPDGREVASGTGPWTLERAGSSLAAYDAAGHPLPLTQLDSGGHWRLECNDPETLVSAGATPNSLHRYRGGLEIWLASGKLYVINEVTLESYLQSVVVGEMGGAPLEALKAQAVAARTFAVCNLGRWTAEGYDLRDSVDSQFYPGAQHETLAATQAVTETAGLILTRVGRPIDAFYCADCGGYTTPGATPDACPNAVNDMETRRLGRARWINWTLTYTPERLGALLRKQASMPANSLLTDAVIVEKDVSGRVRRLRLAWTLPPPKTKKPAPSDENNSPIVFDDTPAQPAQGQENDIGNQNTAAPVSPPVYTQLTGNTLRTLLGLNTLKSTLFTIRQTASGDFVLDGRGYGHGRGMCQTGAMALAAAPFSYDFKTILLHYYARAQLSRVPQSEAEGEPDETTARGSATTAGKARPAVETEQ